MRHAKNILFVALGSVLAVCVCAGKTKSATPRVANAITVNGDATAGPAQQPQTAADAESLKKGGQILLAAVKAAGGRRLLEVKSLGMDEKGEQLNAKGNVTLSVKWTVAYPDRSHGDVMFGTQPVVQLCDGKAAWIVIGAQERDVTRTIGEFKRGIALFGGGWGLYREALAGRVSSQAVGDAEIDGRELNGVTVSAPFGSVKLFFDPKTHLLAAARFQTSTPQGMAEAEQRWSNYRKVDGRQFAFSTASYRGGAKLFESTVSAVRINPPVDDSLFAKPASAHPK